VPLQNYAHIIPVTVHVNRWESLLLSIVRQYKLIMSYSVWKQLQNGRRWHPGRRSRHYNAVAGSRWGQRYQRTYHDDDVNYSSRGRCHV